MDIYATLFDYQKAFNTVPHHPLLYKLSSIALDSQLISSVAEYITLKNQRVLVDGAASRTSPMLFGVPQDSVMSPLLFLICINGVTSIPTSPDTQKILFADDFLLSKAIYAPCDLDPFQ